jgi:hypothetical protein
LYENALFEAISEAVPQTHSFLESMCSPTYPISAHCDGVEAAGGPLEKKRQQRGRVEEAAKQRIENQKPKPKSINQ